MSVVNVLTPNGRRQNVKVQPNLVLIKVLEEVCVKYKFDASEYDLKHHKRIIDLTTTFRFSGLPNNAQLEMVEAQKKRQDCDVELVIQLTNGDRVDGKFKPNDTLHAILQQLCSNECDHEDLVAIFMRTEVTADKLQTTSLKDLGLFNGRGIIRIIRRHPDAAKIQSSVALNLQSKESKEENERDTTSKIRKTNESNLLDAVRKEIAEAKGIELGSTSSAAAGLSANKSNDVKMSDAAASGVEAMEVEAASSVQKQLEKKSDIADEENEDDDGGEIHILGERNALLFTLDSFKSSTKIEPDSFYALNVNDLKLLLKGLRAEAKGSSEQPLLTTQLRDMEKEQEQLNRLNRYKNCIIRIHFPNRYVLQGIFSPYDTIETVMNFIRPYLLESIGAFYLFTTPPKTIVNQDLRLFEANCVPSAVLHFGYEEQIADYFKEEILGKVSSAKACLDKAFEDR